MGVYAGHQSSDLLGYALNGNLLIVNDSVMGQWNYGYDNLNRLVRIPCWKAGKGRTPTLVVLLPPIGFKPGISRSSFWS